MIQTMMHILKQRLIHFFPQYFTFLLISLRWWIAKLAYAFSDSIWIVNVSSSILLFPESGQYLSHLIWNKMKLFDLIIIGVMYDTILVLFPFGKGLISANMGRLPIFFHLLNNFTFDHTSIELMPLYYHLLTNKWVKTMLIIWSDDTFAM